MVFNKKSSLAILLIAVGSLIILNKLGLHMHIMGYLVPIALIGLGYIGIQNGRTKFGWFFAIVGAFILCMKLSGFILLAFAIVMIVYGVSILKNRSAATTWGENQ